MRKLIVIMLVLTFVSSVHAKELGHKSIEINDSTITLPQMWDKTMRWVVANEDTFGMRIAYQNSNTGSVIVKGEFKDANNTLTSVRNGLIIPIVSYTIEVNNSIGKISAEVTEVNYKYSVGYEEIYSLSDYILKAYKQEMEEIERIMRYKGEKVNCYDSWFEETAEEYQAKNTEAKALENDETVPKKERKKAKKYLEQNSYRYLPYLYVNMAPWYIVREVFYGNKGLENFIRKS